MYSKTSFFKASYLATVTEHGDRKTATKIVTSLGEIDTAVQDVVCRERLLKWHISSIVVNCGEQKTTCRYSCFCVN